jgi:DNA-binding transcriptional LysR family regulator
MMHRPRDRPMPDKKAYTQRMELRHLRYFVAVAEEQNISRAALRLSVSQPPISRQIRDLERELKVELFERNGKKIRLSDAGRIFLAEARQVLSRADDAGEVMRLISIGKRGRVRVGYAVSPTVELLPKILRVLSRTHPEIRVELSEVSAERTVNGLRDGSLDVALTVLTSPRNFEGLRVETLATCPLRVAMPNGHRLARRRQVSLKEAAREPIIACSKAQYPEVHAGLAKIFSGYTRALNIVEEYDGIMSIIAAVQAGRGIALVFKSVEILAGQRIVLRPLTPDPAPLPIGLAYREGKVSAATRAFIEAATAMKAKSSLKSFLVV